MELCRKLAVRSVHYYLRSSFLESSEEHFSLEESLEVLRVLVEREKEDCRWLREVDYKGLVNLIRLKDCPEELIPKVLIIVDHIIYMDVEDELTFELVKGCELVPILWTFRERYFGLVMNILANLACQE